ncbi:glycosyltransferase family A protein [Desulfothermus okinawensis JCM 13304]
MKFKILISTTDDKFFKRNYTPPADCLIINQLINIDKSYYDLPQVFSFKEKGISKSRNRALEVSDCNIALISDDDVTYVPNIEEIIKTAFKNYTDADIITFQIKTPTGELYKNYKTKPFNHNLRTIMRVSSIEMAIKVNSIKKVGIKFDQNFGLGSKYPTGEENIFISDALSKRLRIMYIPIPIVVHPKKNLVKIFNHNPKLIQAKGAVFYRIFNKTGYLVSFLFALKNYKYSKYSFWEFYKIMLKGIHDYKLEVNR